MPALYIPDGYTVETVVPAVEDCWNEIPLVYRPPVDDEVERFVAGKLSGAKLLADKVVSLAVEMPDPKDKTKTVPFVPSEENCRRLWSKLRNRIIDIVCDFAEGMVQGKKARNAEGDTKNS